MKLAAEIVKLSLQKRGIKIQLARQSEKREVIHWHRRLNFATGAAEMHGAHGATGPASRRSFARHNQRRTRVGFRRHRCVYRETLFAWACAMPEQRRRRGKTLRGRGPLRLGSGQVRATPSARKRSAAT